MVIGTENHIVSSRKLKVSHYGLAQTFGGHYALPVAEFKQDLSPLFDPEVPTHVEAIPVYLMESESSKSPIGLESFVSNECIKAADTYALRSWTRQDKRVPCALGTGRNGPPWNQVIRRMVYDSETGEKLLDESVDANTMVRQRLPRICDTTTFCCTAPRHPQGMQIR